MNHSTDTGNANYPTALELCRRVGYPDSPLQWNKTAVALLCEDIRRLVTGHDWDGRSGPTDKKVMLVILDMAQGMRRLDVRPPTRDLGQNAGVSKGIACTSLHRLENSKWIFKVEGSRLRKNGGKRNDGQTYLVNPRPLLYKFPHSSYYFPDFARYLWDATSASASRLPVPRRRLTFASQGEYVPHWDRKSGETYTEGITRIGLEISRTDLGLELAPGGLRVALALTDEPVSMAELSRRAKVSPGHTADIVRLKLVPRGLAVNTGGEWFVLDEQYAVNAQGEEFERDAHPGGGWWKGGKWTRGSDLLEYAKQYHTGRVKARGRLYAREQSEHDHWIDLWDALYAAENDPKWAAEILGNGDETCSQYPLLLELSRLGRI